MPMHIILHNLYVKLESTEILEVKFFVCIFWFMSYTDFVRITEYSFGENIFKFHHFVD